MKNQGRGDPHDHRKRQKSHPCGKRRPGRPHIGYGLCHKHGTAPPQVLERKDGKTVARRWLTEKDPDL